MLQGLDLDLPNLRAKKRMARKDAETQRTCLRLAGFAREKKTIGYRIELY
jgi:hypothetical protein